MVRTLSKITDNATQRMKHKKKHNSAIAIRPRFRVICGKDIALGPGKVELLAEIKETGSIVKAAKRLGMSYMRAWTLIQTMERCFKLPLITTERGGATGGGAALTPAGLKALALYYRMEAASLEATKELRKEIKRLLR